MILVFIAIFSILVALGFGGAAAWSDFSKLTIPNLYSLAITLSFIPVFLMMTFFASDAGFFSSWNSHLIAGVAVFILTYILFHFNFIGGGDSKMLTAYALWVGLSGLVPLLFFIGVVGGVLAAITLILNKHQPIKKIRHKNGWIANAQKGKQQVPYGIAIFIGAVITFFNIEYINPETLISLAEISKGS